ncbi:MAG: serine hydrolase domain-containing protein [Gemmatimonadaceae bacterium]
MTRPLLHHYFRVLLPVALSATPLIAQSPTGIDPAALKRLLTAAEATHSDAVVIWKDGRLVGSWHFGKPEVPIEAMSATKSIASLAVGRAVTLGAIPSINDPVARYYPQWRQGQKARITIRQLLDHTSGMQVGESNEVETSPDVVQLALAAELSDAPGARFNYNNKAVNLLAGIVHKATGRRMDELLISDVFARMDFGEFEWVRDSANNAYAYARLKIRPEDLAKLGQLVLDGGRWNGQQLISSAWLEASMQGSKQNPRCGLLWWLIPDRTTFIVDAERLRELRQAGADSAFVARMTTIQGRYKTPDAYTAALQKALGAKYWEAYGEARMVTRMAPERAEYGRFIGYEANGSYGQYLVIYPDQRLVAVRMMAVTETTKVTDSFEAFSVLVRALVPGA